MFKGREKQIEENEVTEATSSHMTQSLGKTGSLVWIRLEGLEQKNDTI